MARTTLSTPTKPQPDPGGGTVNCMLFADKVSPQLCSLRKKELNQKDAFSCFGCSMETVIPDYRTGEQHADQMTSKPT